MPDGCHVLSGASFGGQRTVRGSEPCRFELVLRWFVGYKTWAFERITEQRILVPHHAVKNSAIPTALPTSSGSVSSHRTKEGVTVESIRLCSRAKHRLHWVSPR